MRHLVSGFAALALTVGCGEEEPILIRPASPLAPPVAADQPKAEDLATAVVFVSGMT